MLPFQVLVSRGAGAFGHQFCPVMSPQFILGWSRPSIIKASVQIHPNALLVFRSLDEGNRFLLQEPNGKPSNPATPQGFSVVVKALLPCESTHFTAHH